MKTQEISYKPQKQTIDGKIVKTSRKYPFLSSQDIVRQLNLDFALSTVEKSFIENKLHGSITRQVPNHTKINNYKTK